MGYKNYKDLTVWQRAMDLTDEIYRLIRRLPKEEAYALAAQMRRSAVSIPSNIAEGQGRQTDNEMRNFLHIANGSCMELETQLLICIRLGYIKEEQAEAAFQLCDEIGKILSSFISKISKL